MRIAVANDGLGVSSSFESGTGFTLYTVDQGRITECQNFPNSGLPAPDLVDTLKQFDVCAAISHGFSSGLKAMLKEADIEAYETESDSPRDATDTYLYTFLICPVNLFDDEACAV